MRASFDQCSVHSSALNTVALLLIPSTRGLLSLILLLLFFSHHSQHLLPSLVTILTPLTLHPTKPKHPSSPSTLETHSWHPSSDTSCSTSYSSSLSPWRSRWSFGSSDSLFCSNNMESRMVLETARVHYISLYWTLKN